MEFKDRTGDRIGAMTTTSTWERRGKYITWLCKCDCGGERWVASNYYNDEHIVDCGCGLGHKTDYGKIQKLLKGGSDSSLYNTWVDLKDRCNKESHKAYFRYGGRGIFVCKEWEKSFESFYNDMGDRPFENAQIDRINNDDGYYKDNCRWVTPQQNVWNQGNRRGGSSKYKGVKKYNSMFKGVRWYSSVSRTLNGEYVRKSKVFDTEIEAAEWYNEQAKELFGEYAYLNKIDYSEKE